MPQHTSTRQSPDTAGGTEAVLGEQEEPEAPEGRAEPEGPAEPEKTARTALPEQAGAGGADTVDPSRDGAEAAD
ncbi:hypothetical protein NHG22_15520, partial [Streptomyces sp. ATE26]|nr:hypothetical protein [Streptomyces sp. ATE26]